jgi:hypothetical protein
MKKIIGSIMVAMVMMGLSSTPSHAAALPLPDLINVKFSDSFYDGVAADGNLPPEYWNNVTGYVDSGSLLKYADGTLGDGELLVYGAASWTNINPDATAMPGPLHDLFAGYISSSPNSSLLGDVVITGLNAGTYNLYAYSQTILSVPTHLGFTANGVTVADFTNPGTATILTENVNYVKTQFTVTGGNDVNAGKLILTLAPDSQLNAMQIAPTPEPASMLLIGVGGALMSAMKLRKKKAGEASVAVI